MMTANFLLLLLLFIIIVYIYRINNKNIKKNIQEVSFLPIYETRIRKEQDPIDSLIIEFKGQLPNDYIAKLAFQIHLSTLNSKGIVNRILSNIETFQEAPDSKYFLEYLAIGSTDPYCGSEDWQVIGDIPIDYIQPAVSSESRLVVKVNLIDESIKSEFSEDIIIDSHTHHYPVKFKCKGYLEEGDYEFHIRSIIARLAVAVAYCDSEYHDNEKKVINQWVNKVVKPYGSDQKIKLNDILRKAIKSEEHHGRSENINIENIINELSKSEYSKYFFEAIELVIDVMAADGREASSETSTIENIATSIGIDLDLLEEIKLHKVEKLTKPLVRTK